MPELAITCPNCAHAVEVKVRVELGDDCGDQLVRILRDEIRRRGGGPAGVLASR